MSLENKKIVMFDFDGVLVDTLEIAYGINVEAMPELTLDEYKSFFEGNIHEAIATGKKKAIPDFDEKSRLRNRELKIPEKLKDVIKSLSLNNILVIVSSSANSMIKEILERELVSSFFADIFGSDTHKNKVYKIKILLQKYNVLPENAVFITDTLGDILEAKECGVESIAVTWGFHERETLKRGNPVAIVDDPNLLEETINSVLKLGYEN